MTSGFVVLALLCSVVSVDRDKVTEERDGTSIRTAFDDNMQPEPVHYKFDFRIRTLHHIINPASSCGRRNLKLQFTLSRARQSLHQVFQLFYISTFLVSKCGLKSNVPTVKKKKKNIILLCVN